MDSSLTRPCVENWLAGFLAKGHKCLWASCEASAVQCRNGLRRSRGRIIEAREKRLFIPSLSCERSHTDDEAVFS